MTSEDSPAATAEDHPDPDESIIRLWQERARLTAEADQILALAGDDLDAEQRAEVLDKKGFRSRRTDRHHDPMRGHRLGIASCAAGSMAPTGV